MMTKDDYVDAIKSAFITLATDAAMTAIVAAFPPAATWPLNPLIKWVVKTIITFGANGAETGAFFFYIDMRVSAQANEFTEMALKNRQAQLSGDKDAIKLAENDLIDSFKRFVHFTD